METPIYYAITFAKARTFDFDFVNQEHKKQHILACNMAQEDLDRLTEVEKAAIEFVFARERGAELEPYYQNITKALGVDIKNL